MPTLPQDFGVYCCNLPREFYGDLLSLCGQLVCPVTAQFTTKSKAQMKFQVLTIRSIFQRLDFNTTAAITARVLCMLAHVFPAQIRPQTIHLSTVVPNEKNEVFCGEIACATACGESTGLDYKLDELAAHDVLDKIDCFCYGLLHLAKDEHLAEEGVSVRATVNI